MLMANQLKHFKVKRFVGEAKKADVNDAMLIETLANFTSLDKDGQQRYSLGAGLYKLRLATQHGRGKSGGSRSILAFKQGKRVVWLHLFSKNDKGNVTTSELKKLKILSDILLELPSKEVSRLVKSGELLEVSNNV